MLLTIAPAAQAPDANFLVSLFAELRKTGGITPEAEKRIQPALESIASMSAAQLSDAMPTIVSALPAVVSLLQSPSELAAAGPDHEQIAQRENESIEVRAAAAKALETLR